MTEATRNTRKNREGAFLPELSIDIDVDEVKEQKQELGAPSVTGSNSDGLIGSRPSDFGRVNNNVDNCGSSGTGIKRSNSSVYNERLAEPGNPTKRPKPLLAENDSCLSSSPSSDDGLASLVKQLLQRGVVPELLESFLRSLAKQESPEYCIGKLAQQKVLRKVMRKLSKKDNNSKRTSHTEEKYSCPKPVKESLKGEGKISTEGNSNKALKALADEKQHLDERKISREGNSNKALKALGDEKQHLEEELKTRAGLITSLLSRNASLEEQLESCRKKNEECTTMFHGLSMSYQKTQAENEQLQERVKELERQKGEELVIRNKQDEDWALKLKDLKTSQESMQAENVQLQNRIQQLNQLAKNYDETHQRVQETLHLLQQQNDLKDRMLQRTTERFQEFQESNTKLQQENASAIQKYNELKEAARKQLASAKNVILKLRRQCAETRQQQQQQQQQPQQQQQSRKLEVYTMDLSTFIAHTKDMQF